MKSGMAKKEKAKAAKAETKAAKKKEKKDEPICSGEHAHADLKAVQKEIPPLDTLFQLAELFKMFGDPTRAKILGCFMVDNFLSGRLCRYLPLL